VLYSIIPGAQNKLLTDYKSIRIDTYKSGNGIQVVTSAMTEMIYKYENQNGRNGVVLQFNDCNND
jgi:hypothetical protein